MNLQEIKDTLCHDYKYKIELDAHTSPASRCSEISPREIVKTYKRLGFHAVAVTNHFSHNHSKLTKEEYIDFFLKDFEETEKFGKAIGVKVYLGAEIRFEENRNEYLVFGISRKMLEEIYDFLPFGVENFRNNYSLPHSIFLQAHPLRDGIEKVDPEILDGVEVFNMHPGHNSRIGQVADWAKQNNLSIITAGSDFHHPHKNHEGLAAIRSKYLPSDSFDLAKLLKKGDFLIEICGNIVLK